MKDGGSAYAANLFESEPSFGMSLRDWFAGHALAGIVGERRVTSEDSDCFQDWCEAAYTLADYMLAERAKGKDK